MLKHEQRIINFQLADCSGNEKFNCLRNSYYIGADIIIIFGNNYHIHNDKTINPLFKTWSQIALDICPNAKIHILGNATLHNVLEILV
ncbi:MAG: hypothetical protein EOP34_07115 [Rickettsiales bacterium]|nr:MAG: hypothetical protein EOP34_07115 [Rickettsiales bacterium]